MRTGLLPAALLLLFATPAAAEWQLKPFAALTFGTATTFVDYEMAVPRPHRLIGVTGVLVGEVFGLDADLGRASGFFQKGDQNLLLSSSMTTLTGDVVIDIAVDGEQVIVPSLVDTQNGFEVSAVVEQVPDSHTVRLTLLLPHVNLVEGSARFTGVGRQPESRDSSQGIQVGKVVC